MPLFLKIVLGIVGGLFALAAVSFFLFVTSLDRAKQSVQNTGIATTQAEFEKLFPVTPESKKLVDDILKFRSTSRTEDSEAVISFTQALIEPRRIQAVDWNGISKILQDNSANLTFLDSAAKLSKCSSIDTKNRDEFPLQAAFRQGVQLLCLKAASQWHSGKRLEALESIRKAAVISDQSGRTPTMLSMLVSVACFQMCFRTLQMLVMNGALTEGEKKKLAGIEAVFRDAPDFTIYLKGEPFKMGPALSNPIVPLPPGASKVNESAISEVYLRTAKYLKETSKLAPNSFDFLTKVKKIDAEYKKKYASSLNPIDKLAGAGFVEQSKMYSAYLKRIVFADFIDYMISGKKGVDPYCGTDYGRILGGAETTIYSIGTDGVDNNGLIHGAKAPDLGITFHGK